MLKKDIERQKEVCEVSLLLRELEVHGLEQVCVASGWIRGWLMDLPRTDIDIAYIGSVPYEKAQLLLKQSVHKLGLSDKDWDLTGIWNATQAHPEVTSIELHYLLDYVCSIDSVYLASDGKLHDTTGFGFEDATTKTLRMNDWGKMQFKYKKKGIIYLCLEGCRRIAKFGWKPTERSIELIHQGLELWNELSSLEKREFYSKRIANKFPIDQWSSLKKIYDEYGWGFIFDEARQSVVKLNYKDTIGSDRQTLLW